MDRRIQKTRAAIFAAFDTLIQKNAYADISVQDIIDEANVGRSTFYEHFSTKDELLRQKCTDLFEHIFAPSGTEKTHYFSPSASFRQMTTHILYHLLDDKETVKGILSGESGEMFLRHFRRYVSRLTDTIDASRLARNDVPESFVHNHIAGSFIEMVRWWADRDFSDAPEDVTRYFASVLCL